jgi:hypothetical protein
MRNPGSISCPRGHRRKGERAHFQEITPRVRARAMLMSRTAVTFRATLAFLTKRRTRFADPSSSQTWRGRMRPRRAGAPSTAIAIAAIILLASVPLTHVGALQPQQAPRPTGGLSLSARGAVSRPASMGLSAASLGAAQGSPGSSDPTYDEQIGMTFTQDLGALTYNVTALAQADANGYGPAYLLNGLTTAGYWYQVGISYHWPDSSGSYDPTFGFSYQVYGPDGKSVYPTDGAGLGTFSKAVQSGDSVLLSLTFSGSSVQMLAQDWDTGATAETSYSGMGASSFVGDPSSAATSSGYFTGLMTEWYHTTLYAGNEGKVIYSNQAVALSSAWLWVDEFDTQRPDSPIFTNQTQSPVTFSNELQIYPFSSDGITVYGSAHQFITGLLSTISSRVALTPATQEAASPSFSVSYTLAGLQQSADIPAGTAGNSTVVEADPGTSVTISLSSGSSALDRWVFSGSDGSAVTFPAGSNVTYAYYHLVQETVSYQLAGTGKPVSASSAPELVYETPPAVPSATPTQVAATQLLGTSPVEILALLGSEATLNVTIAGDVGERWAASAQGWSVSAPNVIPDPIRIYQQYEVSISHSIVGGGTPPDPEFASTSLGSPIVVDLSAGTMTGWFDAGSAYSFTSVLNGSNPGERWLGSGGGGSATSVISAPDGALSEVYTHQYYVGLGVNDPSGGSVTQESGWFEVGSSLRASASPDPQWRFETWNGSGAGAYAGTDPSLDVTVMGPLSENATFYVQLSIAAGAGLDIGFSYGSDAGTVQSGTVQTLYVPPSSNVTLRATPSDLVYSFASWQGTGLAKNATRPSLALVVDSPTAVTGTSSYNLPVVLGGAATAAVIILIVAGSLLIRSRRSRRGRPGDSGTSTDLTRPDEVQPTTATFGRCLREGAWLRP